MTNLVHRDGNSNGNFEAFPRVIVLIIIIYFREIESKCAMKTCDAPARKKDNHDDSCASNILNSIKVRAILLRCPCDSCSDNSYNDKRHPISPLRKEAITAFPGFDSDETIYHNEVTRCRRKLLITLEIKNGGKVSCDDEFIVINRVYDPTTKRKVRLLNTYVLKVRQEQTLQTYGLEFKQVVNGEAKEEVIDKRSTGFTGCEELSEQPTCGVAYYHGTLVPGSHGFCCSCNSSLNLQRQREYTDLLRQFLAEEHYVTEMKGQADSPSVKLSTMTKFKKEIKAGLQQRDHGKVETTHRPSYEDIFHKHNTSSEGYQKKDVDREKDSHSNHEQSKLDSADTDLKNDNYVKRQQDDGDTDSLKNEHVKFLDSKTLSRAKLSHAERNVKSPTSSAKNYANTNLLTDQRPTIAQVSVQNSGHGSITVSKGTSTTHTNGKNGNVFSKTQSNKSQKALTSINVRENGAGIVSKPPTHISQYALNNSKILAKETGVFTKPRTSNTQNSHSRQNIVENGASIASETPTYKTENALISSRRIGDDSIAHTSKYYDQDALGSISFETNRGIIENPPKYDIQNQIGNHASQYDHFSSSSGDGTDLIAHDFKSQDILSRSLLDGKSKDISEEDKYKISDSIPTGVVNQYNVQSSPTESKVYDKNMNRRLRELRRRKALQKALNRNLDLISDLVKTTKHNLKVRKERDAEEQFQCSDDEDLNSINDVNDVWFDDGEELRVVRRVSDDANYEVMDTGPLVKRLTTLVKRSPHGGAKKKSFKIPIEQTPESNMDVKPKLVRKEEKERRAEKLKKDEEIDNVTEEKEDLTNKNCDNSKQEKKSIVENKTNGVKESDGNFIDDAEGEDVVSDDEEDSDEELQDSEERRKRSSGSRVLSFVLEDTDGGFTLARERTKRVATSNAESRGARNCGDSFTPPDMDPEKYHESAHCLRYSDLWYTVYGLKSPIILHTVYIQLFEKHSLEDGTSHWQDLTRGKMVRLGTLWRKAEDETPTIAFTYTPLPLPTSPSPSFALDPRKVNLLVPQPVAKHKADKYPQVKGGPTEFLVVNNGEIGHQCDKAGIGYQGFVTQEDRCSRPPGACLKNQPADLWRSDMRAQQEGRKGRYFLGNYGTVPCEPIKSNPAQGEYLALEYHGVFKSAIDVEVKADFNPLIRLGSNAQITEVYVDSTCNMMTKLTVVLSNTGLASSSYRVLLAECAGAPKSWTRTQSQLINIPPQHVKVAELKLVGAMPTSSMHCSVEVVNCRNELVATRRVRFRRMDRCFCVWYCLCACIGSATGLECDQMSPQHYHAAGFQGSIPVAEVEEPDTFWLMLVILLLGLFLILLLLGLTKAILGLCCCPIVGAWGLNVLVFHPIRLEEYYEPHLEGREVIYDEDGYPVHPDSHAHTVRAMSKSAEFCLNVIFFLALPLTICWACCRRCCWVCCGYSEYDGDVDSRVVSKKHEDHICFETFDDDDTQYVIEELKRSKESIEELDETTPLLNTEADDYMKRLLASKVVFRNLREPTGGVQLPKGIPYCIRGFFIKIAEGYEFTTPKPFKQYWIFEDGDLQMMTPPQALNSDDFEVRYATAQEVFEHKQLSCLPKGFCVNVRFQDDMDFEDEDDDF